MKKIVRTTLLGLLSIIFMTTSASALTCVALTKTLSKGSENNDVLTLQQFLFDGGYLIVKPNGYFGENTKKAVYSFQKKQNISPTGSVGPLTMGKIHEISCSASTTAPTKSTSTISTTVIKEEKTTTTKVVVPIPPVQNTHVVTTPQEVPTIYAKTLLASNITPTTATFNSKGGIDGEKHWFEWGTSMTMSNKTPETVASTSYSYAITALLPNTTYYFRSVTSVATSTNGKKEIAYGEMRYFITPPPAVVAPTAPTVTISTTGIAVNTAGSAKIVWKSTNTTTCTFTGGEDGGDWTKQTALSGEYVTRRITRSTIFGISCKNNSEYTVTGSVTLSSVKF